MIYDSINKTYCGITILAIDEETQTLTINQYNHTFICDYKEYDNDITFISNGITYALSEFIEYGD